ncbi:MAG: response regulator [Chloroflexota bacterium]
MMRVLYVEDDAGSRDVLRMVARLHADALAVTIFDDSTDFEARLLALPDMPHLILLDIHMQPYTGFEMLEMIKAHDAYATTPVVALTASVMTKEVQMLRKVGFHSMLSKPIDMDQFFGQLQRIRKGDTIWYIG